MTDSSEFTRLVKLDRLPQGKAQFAPDAAEREALAARFDLASLESLEAELAFEPEGTGVLARGRLTAAFHQLCAVALEPFANTLDEPLAIRFVSALADLAEDVEHEFDADEPDEIEFDGQAIDVGEAIAQSFGLAIDPYAEGPDAADARAAGGVVREGEGAGPLADALSALNLKPRTP